MPPESTSTEVNTGAATPSSPIEGVAPPLVLQPPPAPVEGQPARESWWPEGVNSPEDLQRYFTEGAGKVKEADPNAPPVDPNAAPKEGEPPGYVPLLTAEQVKANLQQAGGLYADPKYEPYALEVNNTGTLSDASIEKAAADFGVTPNVVKDFFAGQQARVTMEASQAASQPNPMAVTAMEVFTGDTGVQDYAKFQEWGSTRLPAEEQAAYNAALDRGDKVTVKALLSSFRTRWQAEGNGTRRDITASGAPPAGSPASQAGGVQPFGSNQEGLQAMNDPRYKVDPAYRASVDARFAITP